MLSAISFYITWAKCKGITKKQHNAPTKLIFHVFRINQKNYFIVRIREGRRTELAMLSGNCRTLKIPAEKKPKIILSQIRWHFKDATDEDRVQFMKFKERQGQEESLPETRAAISRPHSLGNAFSGQQLTPITPTSLDLQSSHVCDTSRIFCSICNSSSAAYPSP